MPPRPVPLPAPHDHTATRLETDEDVLNALRASLGGMPVAPLPQAALPAGRVLCEHLPPRMKLKNALTERPAR